MQQKSIKEIFPLNDKRKSKQEEDENPFLCYKMIYESRNENLVFEENKIRIVSIWGKSELERGHVFFKAGTEIDNIYDLYQEIGIKKDPYDRAPKIMQVEIKKNTPFEIMLRVIHDVNARVPFLLNFLGEKGEGRGASSTSEVDITNTINENSHDFIRFKLGSSFFIIPVFFKMQD